jgi:hypothetical protein
VRPRSARCALLVIGAERYALVVPKIKPDKIALQLVLAHVLIHTIDAALEDRKVAFDRVRMCIAAEVFVRRMDTVRWLANCSPISQ